MKEWSIGGIIINRGKSRNPERNLRRCHFVHHKSQMKLKPDLRGQMPEIIRLMYGTVESLTVLCPHPEK
jgi:hypothetical protein